MYHHKGYRKLGRKSAHRKALFRNLAISLFEKGKIKTTLTVAKELRRAAEKLITISKKGNLSHLMSLLGDKKAFKKMTEITAKYKARNGGYTRIIRIGTRKGDTAPLAIIELVE